MLGIGGTGMAALAGLLSQLGHTITGSDNPIYPPMSDLLKSLNISPYEGYHVDHLDNAMPDMVIIGNVIRKDNPEAQAVLNGNYKYLSMPAAIAEFFLKDRTSIVVAGTHGKTTTSNLIAWLLSDCNMSPGFFVGGIGNNFSVSFDKGTSPLFVLEGDEYDTAFFDKGPKFLHYQPQALQLTSIEYDHADIYDNVDQIIDRFVQLIRLIPPDGLLIANSDDSNVRLILEEAACRVITYGLNEGADYHITDFHMDHLGTHFSIKGESFSLPLWGQHNLSNALGAIALLHEMQLPLPDLSRALHGFQGVKRRQEIIAQKKGITIIDDFAHHPTAVKKTIAAMKSRYPQSRVWAVFEPRSNTSRQNIFENDYVAALCDADMIIIAHPYKSNAINQDKRLNSQRIANTLMQQGLDAHAIEHTDHIVEYVMRGIDYNDVILVMSNGHFDNICEKLNSALDKRRVLDDRYNIASRKVPS